MMKRLFPPLIVALVCFAVLPVSAQTSNQLPREAVAFGYRGGTRIAVLNANGDCHFEDLPNAYSGTAEVNGTAGTIAPVWAPDKPTAYVVAAAPGEAQHLRWPDSCIIQDVKTEELMWCAGRLSAQGKVGHE